MKKRELRERLESILNQNPLTLEELSETYSRNYGEELPSSALWDIPYVKMGELRIFYSPNQRGLAYEKMCRLLIGKICEEWSIDLLPPGVIEEASQMFSRACETGTRVNYKKLAKACLVRACAISGIPLPPERKKERIPLRLLSGMPILPLERYIPRICDDLKLSPEERASVIEKATGYVRAIPIAKRMGIDPQGICAAAVYKACKELEIERSQTRIAMAAKTTNFTLRKNLRRFMEYWKDVGI